jgi:MYXO-CTERM domain-containing protein
MVSAHGGTPGLIAELLPLLLLLLGGIAVWRRSREQSSDAPGPDDEPRVEEEHGDRERARGGGLAEPE